MSSVSPQQCASNYWNGANQFYPPNRNNSAVMDANTREFYGYADTYDPEYYRNFNSCGYQEPRNAYANANCVEDYGMLQQHYQSAKSGYLNTFDTCRQAIYNDSSRSSPNANDLSPSPKILESPQKSDTSDSPALRALLSTPRDKKITYPQSYSQIKKEQPPQDASEVKELINEIQNNYYPWMKASNRK